MSVLTLAVLVGEASRKLSPQGTHPGKAIMRRLKNEQHVEMGGSRT
jgi:hypothetical protein